MFSPFRFVNAFTFDVPTRLSSYEVSQVFCLMSRAIDEIAIFFYCLSSMKTWLHRIGIFFLAELYLTLEFYTCLECIPALSSS